MHRSVDVVQEIVRLGNELEAVAKETLLDLLLARGEELIGVAGLNPERIACRRRRRRFLLSVGLV